MSSELESAKESSSEQISAQPEIGSISVRSRLTFALRRNIAMMLDLIIANSFMLLPAIVLGFRGGFRPDFGFFFDPSEALAQNGAAASIMFALLCTPLPLIYLRIFFKVFKNGKTPGESLAGIVSYSTQTGLSKWVCQLSYGLCQYLMFVFSLVASTYLSFIGACFFGMLLGSPRDELFDGTGWFILILWPLTIFLIWLLFHLSFSRKSYQALADYKMNAEVRPEMRQPQITASVEPSHEAL